MIIEERSSTHVYKQKRMLSKEALAAVESLCVHEQPAYCVAACPLKLDAKALMAAVARGDWAGARGIYEKVTPFTRLLSAGCEAPCESKCRLSSLGDGIEIREIERAVARFGEKAAAKGLLRFKKKKTVALFGSGLFSIFLIGELARKAYPLTVFCAEPDLKSFMARETGFMDGEALAAETETMAALDVDFRFSTNLARMDSLRAGFDVCCASAGAARQAWPGARSDERIMMFREENLVMGCEGGVTAAAFGAKKAALTVDRLAQNLDPCNSRGEEGPCSTKLYTSTEGAERLRKVAAGPEGYDKTGAESEAGRCIQCRCEECIKGCAYLRHYHKFPRILTREIYNNVSIIMGDHMMNKPINACSLCGQCSVTCPNGYDMGEICHIARQNMVATDKMPLAPHEFALMDMLFSNGEAFLCLPQPGYEKCKYVFFPGCQASAVAPETVKAAYKDLCSRLSGGVALMLGCCGAICDWAGRYEMYGETVEFIDEKLRTLGSPEIIAGCPSCKKELSAHEGLRVRGIWELLCELGLPEGAGRFERPAALHDSCGARGDAETQRAVRRLAEMLGCRLVDTDYSGDRSPCCGYGGLTAYANPQVAREMTQSCLQRSGEPYISYCMACRDRFAREGRESRHILELVYGTAAGAPPDISRKRYNRLNLKRELLKELWGQESEKVEREYKLEFTDEALEMMDRRMILESDVYAVMDGLRETGEAVYDSETDYLIARRRLGNVTFWVKYREKEDGYVVHRAYSHRMNVVQRQG